MKHNVIDIYFTDRDGLDDKTQLDFDGDWNSVMQCWEDFCLLENIEPGCFGGYDIYEIDEDGYEPPIDNGHCPVCGSGDIEGEQIDVYVDGCYQPCKCIECGAHWNDTYRFDRRTEIERG